MSSIDFLGSRVEEGTFYGNASLSPIVAGSSWSPLSLTGLLAWYDWSNTGSITSSSNLVSQINDLSGNANHLTQSTGAQQPSTGVNTINGLNAGTFASSKWVLNTTLSSAGSQPYTLYMVVNITTFANFGFIFGRATQDANVSGIGTRSTPSFMIRSSTSVSSTATVTTGTTYSVVATLNGASSTITVNGTTDTLSPGAVGLGSQLWIGSQNDGQNDSFYGKGGEFVCQSGIGSASDKSSWASYVSSKWAAI